jgi:hypothetical protein
MGVEKKMEEVVVEEKKINLTNAVILFGSKNIMMRNRFLSNLPITSKLMIQIIQLPYLGPKCEKRC